MKRKFTALLLCLLLLLLPTLQAHAEENGPWYYSIENGTAKITGYYGDESGHVDIPAELDGYIVTAIGNSAFLGREITSVTFPDTVTVIGDFSFAHCPNLTSVNISANVTFIDSGAFMDCKSLTGIWVDPQNWDYSSDEQGVLYSKNKMTLVQVPASFRGEFVIPEGVIDIGFAALEGCDSLTAVTIAESVQTIGGYAFSGCSGLTELTIPALVEYIGNDAFESCSSLSSIKVAENSRFFCTDENGNLCTKDQSQIVYVPGAFSGEYVVPEGTTRIGENFMSNCAGLTSVTIPEGVTEIGHYAFANCENLQRVTIAESVSSIDAYTFEGCESLAQVNLPEAVTHIQWGLFRGCRMLTQLPVHDKVTVIDDFAFAECHSLTDIVIPASVEYVGHYAFHDCRGLQNIYFLGDAPEFVNHENINGSFARTRATAYYHTGTNGWTEENKAKTGGYITWVELEHIVLEEGPDSRCAVCGEKADKKTSVNILTPDQPENTEQQNEALPRSVENPVTENPDTADPFAVSTLILLMLAAAGWGLWLKQRWTGNHKERS